MLRRTATRSYYWSRYRMPVTMAKMDGPAPVAAPQNMNSTRTNEFIDPIDDKFPHSIRGTMVRPDVPEDQYVDLWYVCTSTPSHRGDFRPWAAQAPADAYRFRPFDEFDARGREVIESLRQFDTYDANKSVGKGQKGFPQRDLYLTRMNPENKTTPPPTLQTTMERAIAEKHKHRRLQSPLEEQRDVGRIEQPLPSAGKLEVDKSRFPYNWKTEDWYEYEISRARNKRFVFENNTNGAELDSSEVTYKIVLEGQWDHHVLKLAEDVCMFFKEVGRQIVEERLIAIRRQLEELESGTASIDPEVLRAFNAAQRGPFGSSDSYDEGEVASFLAQELRLLERQCVSLINRTNVPIPGATNLYDANVSWPFVEKLEPWVRMAEYWTSASDTSFTELEMSTAHVEFRKFFRVVVVKMPFQSSEFEKRMYDIRHWLHRHCTAEFQTIYKKNFVHDAAKFPTEHDPLHGTTSEHHRMFSFALDWQSAPANYLSVETVVAGDTWSSIAARLGTTEAALRGANVELELPVVGETVTVPQSATRRLTSFGGTEQMIPLIDESGNRVIHTWEDAANAIGCTIEELQMANGPAAHNYNSEKNAFDDATVQLNVPVTAKVLSGAAEFASIEEVMINDTFESIAARIGCSVEDLKASNPTLQQVTDVGAVNVPATATNPRRLTEPLLRPAAATASLIPSTMGDMETIPEMPSRPKNAEKYPHEYHSSASRFPPTPLKPDFEDNWLSYTAKFLDRELKATDQPTPLYNVNKLWPMQQVPGKVDQTPFEEDQTWLLHHTPVQQTEFHHPEKDSQDLPFVNHEQFPKSLEWTAP